MLRQIRELYDYRQMIVSLVRRDLRGRYKGSVLGFLWTFINPLFQLAVYTFVFSCILKSSIDRYYLYLFVALIPWIFFSSSVTGGASSITAQKDLVKKIWFPRQVLPIAYVTSCFVNMLLCFAVILAVVLFSGVRLHPLGALCLPLIMAVEYLLALGMALTASAVTVYFRDMEHILGIITMAWMYLTPIMYDASFIPERWLPLFRLNPMTGIISCYRTVLYSGGIPQLSLLAESFGLGILFLLLGWIVFDRLQRRFAEEL